MCGCCGCDRRFGGGVDEMTMMMMLVENGRCCVVFAPGGAFGTRMFVHPGSDVLEEEPMLT